MRRLRLVLLLLLLLLLLRFVRWRRRVGWFLRATPRLPPALVGAVAGRTGPLSEDGILVAHADFLVLAALRFALLGSALLQGDLHAVHVHVIPISFRRTDLMPQVLPIY